jgi:3-deoxy-D-manno-octulosonic-acid transferase
MHFVYSLCFTLGFFLGLPYFLCQAVFHRKYLVSFRQRLGDLPKELASITEGGIWIHAVSVGEVLAVLPLVNALRHNWPGRPLWVSTTTLTGQKLANSKLGDKAKVFYFPLDWKFAVQRSLGVVRPAIVLIAETEIWPNFLLECRVRRIPVLLVNGRLSDRSVRRYSRIRQFMKKVLTGFQYCCMQTRMDRERLLSLGASHDKVEVCGNLKYDIAVPDGIQAKTKTYRKLFDLDESRFVIVAGSTMRDEETAVLSAFRTLRCCCPQATLILAPRHLERVKEVEVLLREQAFEYSKRSQLRLSGASSFRQTCEVILLDSMGELATLYALADLVFIGGSLVPTGGHNILEPALYRKPILFGPHMSNFREVSEHFLEKGAAIRVETSADLGVKLVELYENAGLRRSLGENGHAILTANRGATQRILSRVVPLLSNGGTPSSDSHSGTD